MVKKKGQKSAQSKKKLDLAAAVEAAEQGDEEELSKLNLNADTDADDALAVSGDRTENGSANDDDSGNNEEQGAALMNYNPPEENPSTEDTGKIKFRWQLLCSCDTRDY